MSIRVADETIGVQRGAHPVHPGIRRQARLGSEYVIREISVTLCHGVEPRSGAQNREPWRPDMRGYEVAAGAGLQRDLKQVTGVKAKDGPAVRGKVAELRQRARDAVCGAELRHVYQVMYFPCPLITSVDGGDLHGQHEADRLTAGAGNAAPHLAFHLGPEPEEPRFGGDEALFQLIGPSGMREVAGADHGDALAQCPRSKMQEV